MGIFRKLCMPQREDCAVAAFHFLSPWKPRQNAAPTSDPQGFLYLTYSGKSSDGRGSERMRQALGMTQLIYTKEQLVNDNRKEKRGFPYVTYMPCFEKHL